MSNFLAVATVTATLGQLLQAAVGTDVPGATVTRMRPEAVAGGLPDTRVNLYLYQVTTNTAWRNADVPTRRPNGQLVQCPQVALDLHYLLSFYGNEEELEPQRLLGSAVRTLHARSILTRQMIQDTVTNPAFAFLANSNLADGIELVKFTPLPLSLEELSKLWSVFFQVSYTLSIAYQGTVVLIESAETPQATLPVRARNLYVVPFRQPVIEQVMASTGVEQPIVSGSTLRIRGRQLRGEVTQVRIGGLELAPAAQDVSDTQVSLLLSAPSLRAGVQGVQVIYQHLMGTPPVAHRGVESNVMAFVLRPTITAASATATDVTVQVAPEIGPTQRVVLLLNAATGVLPASYTFVAPARTAATTSLTIPVSGVPAGNYLVRVQVDGAESPLTVDTNPASPTFHQYIGPQVTMP